ncbi:MAG: tRNA 2-thiouridine(34) synthase MnmA [Pseudomonadales bacterium]
MNTAPTVVVGLSGGVDSAMAALLLQQQGYAVTGLFMKNWDEDDGSEYCTAVADLADAQQVAEQLGIELLTANFAAEYWDNVFEAFLAEYAAGRTPNPDVLCNREIKFRYFADYASALGADFIATGHYARIQHDAAGPRLLQALDRNKDQTYFLQSVQLAQLGNTLFPLGALQKAEVRQQARAAGFGNHAKKDSTGICFIGERRFRDFLSRYLPAKEGRICDVEGRTLGQHPGTHLFTLGQRQGLRVGGVQGQAEAPWYVLAKDRCRNQLTVTQDLAALDSHWLAADELNWLLPTAPALPLRCRARIRHRQALQECELYARADGRIGVRFEQPQRAVNPGQYVCLYQDELCLGGGRIVANGRAR